MIKLPKSIKVGPYEYEVKHVELHECEECIGDFSSKTGVIRVEKRLPPRRTMETLQHEVFHAIYYSFSLEDEDKEERYVSVFSTAYFAVLMNNPEYTKLLMEHVQ